MSEVILSPKISLKIAVIKLSIQLLHSGFVEVFDIKSKGNFKVLLLGIFRSIWPLTGLSSPGAFVLPKSQEPTDWVFLYLIPPGRGIVRFNK